MQVSWWYSSKQMTVLVVEDSGIIVRTAPVVGKFVGQPVLNLQRWMYKHGKFQIECLSPIERSTMVPPKPPVKTAAKASAKPAKAAPKAKGATPPTESVFAAMKKQGSLAKNMAKAKQVVAVREFDGPDGDYSANLTRVSHYTKDGSLGIVFELRITDEGDVQGQKLVMFFIFKQTDRETVQEIQCRFFETLQLMGIDTDIDDAQLEKELNALIANKTEITIRIKSGKTGGKFTTVIGLASAAEEVEDTEYVEEEATEVEEEATDEWEEEVPEEEAVEVEEEATLPSAWIGYAMIYKGTEVEVTAANDETMKCTIKAGTKKLIVPFSQLEVPPEVEAE